MHALEWPAPFKSVEFLTVWQDLCRLNSAQNPLMPAGNGELDYFLE